MAQVALPTLAQQIQLSFESYFIDLCDSQY